MKLSWLIEMIQNNSAGRHEPQCILMGQLAYEDTKLALFRSQRYVDPSQRTALRPPYLISGVPILLDSELPELTIRLLRNDGSAYTVVGTYRP